MKPTGKRIKHPDLPSETIEEVRNIIPVTYNVQTQLAIEVTPDGANAFPFDLTSRGGWRRGAEGVESESGPSGPVEAMRGGHRLPPLSRSDDLSHPS